MKRLSIFFDVGGNSASLIAWICELSKAACSPMVWSTVGASVLDRLGALSTGRTFVTEKTPFRLFFREATRETDSGKNLLINETQTN